MDLGHDTPYDQYKRICKVILKLFHTGKSNCPNKHASEFDLKAAAVSLTLELRIIALCRNEHRLIKGNMCAKLFWKKKHCHARRNNGPDKHADTHTTHIHQTATVETKLRWLQAGSTMNWVHENILLIFIMPTDLLSEFVELLLHLSNVMVQRLA